MIADLVVNTLNDLAIIILPHPERIVNMLGKIRKVLGKAMVKITLFSFWKEKEKEQGRKITASEVAAATGLSRNTLTAYLSGDVERPDLEVVSKLCKFFGVSTGPVPFIHYEADD